MIYYIRNSIEGLIGFYYNQEKYYYIKNNLEDITGILDSNYNLVASYTYDSWGNIISIRDSNGLDISTNETHIANINPYRYRSYYYDIETNLYYLNSRYYNPQWGRFLNADGIIGSNSILGNNLYNYCYNHPIGKKDLNGFAAMDLASILISGAEKTVETVFNHVNNRVTNKNEKSSVVTKNENKTLSLPRNRGNKNKMPTRGMPPGTMTAPNGDKRVFGPDGLSSVDQDWSHPQHHPDLDNPHNHDWSWPDGPEGKPVRGKAYNVDSGVKTVAVVAVVYLVIKWGTAAFAAPATGGGSLIIAGVTP